MLNCVKCLFWCDKTKGSLSTSLKQFCFLLLACMIIRQNNHSYQGTYAVLHQLIGQHFKPLPLSPRSFSLSAKTMTNGAVQLLMTQTLCNLRLNQKFGAIFLSLATEDPCTWLSDTTKHSMPLFTASVPTGDQQLCVCPIQAPCWQSLLTLMSHRSKGHNDGPQCLSLSLCAATVNHMYVNSGTFEACAILWVTEHRAKIWVNGFVVVTSTM